MRATGTANWGHETMIRPFRMTALKGALAVSLLMLAGLPAQRVQAQSDQWNALYDRIIRLEHEVRTGGAGGGAGNAQIQQQLQQLSAQVAAMQQQMMEMQRELNRLRELERQGLLFKNQRTAAVISPQQQPQQWNQGQVAPDYGQMQQSVVIEGQDTATGQLPRGGLAPGPQTLGTMVLRDDQAPTPIVPQQPQYQQPQAQPYQLPQAQPYQPPQPQMQQPQAQYQPPQPLVPQQDWQPRQVQGVQSNTLPPPPGTGGQPAPGSVASGGGQPQYQLQSGPQAWQPEPEPSFDAEGRPIVAEEQSGGLPPLAPEKVETALLDGSAGGGNLAAGSTTAGGAVDDQAGRLFLQAKSSYTSRDFTGAVSGFRTFILQHRDHELADDAQFLLGEAYYAQGNWREAAQSYLAGYQNFPDSDKSGENLLKLAMSLDKLGQKKKACATFAEVNKKFAKEAAVRNASLKEMQRAGCN
jgi:tol-pal system protein YbgF